MNPNNHKAAACVFSGFEERLNQRSPCKAHKGRFAQQNRRTLVPTHQAGRGAQPLHTKASFPFRKRERAGIGFPLPVGQCCRRAPPPGRWGKSSIQQQTRFLPCGAKKGRFASAESPEFGAHALGRLRGAAPPNQLLLPLFAKRGRTGIGFSLLMESCCWRAPPPERLGEKSLSLKDIFFFSYSFRKNKYFP